MSSIAEDEELDDNTPLRADKIIVDDITQIMKKSGLKPKFDRGILSICDIYGELSEIILGKKQGRESDEEAILLVTEGMPIEDIIVLNKIYPLAKKNGVGTLIKLF